jgi:hypothetical protein
VHQGDVVRAWHGSHLNSRDVAIELPTGAGKTLVGGLIADWRRRARNERVAYLCPTRQLAQQTKDNLDSYGIPTVLLVGRVATWSMADRARYTAAGAVAVSVYSHVFNSNPAIDDAQMLVLDDAHGAESYVSSPWTIEIERSEPAYLDVLSAVENAFDPQVVRQLRSDSPNGHFATDVYLGSPSAIAAGSTQLEEVLEKARDDKRLNRSAGYALDSMRGRLDRCLLYASYRRLELRPLIAPTGAHAPFDEPAQRLYMSATLGSGGELERSFGRTRIERIPVPKGWDHQGTGRRFFCFPELTTDLSLAPEEADHWVSRTILQCHKGTVLTPDNRTADAFRLHRIAEETAVFTADDIEADLDVFAAASDGALLLTNRYDGIDLPDEACRLVVLQDLPARGDLQERFLFTSLGAIEVLQERVRSRIAQGAGRATRNAGDFAVVVVLGADLLRFCSRREVQGALHPELHAEISFGLEESFGVSSVEMTENIQAFLDQSSEWQDVEQSIVIARGGLEREEPPGAAELSRAASLEVGAWLAAWQGEWERALELAREVIDALRGGRASQRYAALWNYLAASWAARLADQSADSDLLAASDSYMEAARAAGRGTVWLSHLLAPDDAQRSFGGSDAEDPVDRSAVEGVAAAFARLGRSSAFDGLLTELRSSLGGTSPRPYEQALVKLGGLAGASETRGNGGADAAPDATWIFGDALWVGWEAKSDAKPDGELGATDVRQAGSHLRFIESEMDTAAPPGSLTVISSPQVRIHPAASQVAEEHVFLMTPAEVMDLVDRLVRAWTTLRARHSVPPPTDAIHAALQREGCLPSQWLHALSARSIAVSVPLLAGDESS